MVRKTVTVSVKKKIFQATLQLSLDFDKERKNMTSYDNLDASYFENISRCNCWPSLTEEQKKLQLTFQNVHGSHLDWNIMGGQAVKGGGGGGRA